MSSANSKNKKVSALVADLKSGNQEKILGAIKSLQAHGDVSVLEPMVEILLQEKDSKIGQTIINFLSDLKDSGSAEIMIEIIKNDKFIPLRKELLTTVWSSKVDYSYYLAEFVAMAVDGDFMEALDCLTILENLEGPFEERHILEAQLHLKDYLENRESTNDQKAQIMSEIALLIKDFDQDLEA
jgi:hypothetical protein